MNSLSWFLYLADIVGNIGFLCGAAVLLLGLACLASALIGFLAQDEDAKLSKRCFKAFKFAGISLAVVTFIGAITPSKNTMYAIAASEIGEEAVKSKVGQKSLQALEQWLDSQISKDKK